ncbi:MAG: DedA family protein [Microbacterium sp.]|uniref:DedA family protein n=1 Tax=Microbacterium sp. TaxID=51671 RepID=UPI0039E376D7
MNDALSWLLDAVQHVPPLARVLIAGVAVMLETSVLVGLIVPGDTIVIVAGASVTSPLQGFMLWIAVVLGSLAGESLGFLLGRYLGPWLRRSRLGRWIGEKNWVRSERYVRRRGGPAVFLSRFLPVLHSLVPLTVGMTGFRYRRFLAWTAPACALWAGLYIAVSAAAAGTYRDMSEQIHFAGYLFVGAIVLFVLLVFGVRKLIARLERRHLEDDDELNATRTDEAPPAGMED